MDKIVIPKLQCDKSTVSEAVETIRTAARDHDAATTDVNERGVNIFLKLPAGARDQVMGKLITLDLKDISLRKALEVVSEQSGLKMRVEPYAVSLVPSK